MSDICGDNSSGLNPEISCMQPFGHTGPCGNGRQMWWARGREPGFKPPERDGQLKNSAVLGNYRKHAIARGYVHDIHEKPVVPSALGDLWDEAYATGQAAERARLIAVASEANVKAMNTLFARSTQEQQEAAETMADAIFAAIKK